MHHEIETRSRADQLLDMRLNIKARFENGSWNQEKADLWTATVDKKLKEINS